MYKLFIRPLLFLFDPEKVHHFTFSFLKITLSIPGIKQLVASAYTVKDQRLEKEVFGLKFKNPVGLAAGFDKNALILHQLPKFGFGFIEIGTVTPKPQVGNPKKRLFRLKEDKALINRMGFNNDGAELIATRLKSRPHSITIGGNIGKNTATSNDDAKADYIYNINALHPHVDYFVLNVSCPNVGNTQKLNDKNYLIDLLTELKQLIESKGRVIPLVLKIGPDRSDAQLDEVIEIVEKTKIAGVIASNTATDRSNLNTSQSRLEEIGNGGLSGQPLKNRSTEIIRYLSTKSNKAFPIIGVGGIHSAEDALEKIEAGADLVQVYTGFIYEGPSLIKKINRALLKK